jgi:probable F420-dependent oxidoreductase
MHLGVVFSQAASGLDADAIRAFAVRAEEAGFHHILAYDHILGASVEKLGPGPFGAFPAAPYTDQNTFWEILTLYSHWAAITERIQFVTSVLVLPQRQTALAAKQIATIDRLSGGRMNVAVGTGWNPAEYEGLAADYPNRTAVLEEQIELMRKLWSEPLVTFDGRFHHLDGVGINPLPDRTIPIYIGTRGHPLVLRRVVRVADGWMPLLVPGLDVEELGPCVVRLREICEREGRDPATLPIWGRTYLADGWQKNVEQAVELGFEHFALGVGRGDERPQAEHLETLIEAKAEADSIIG